MPGRLILIGSGETGPTIARLHRRLLKAHRPRPRAVLLDTPAGFELGREAIAARFQTYFRDRLATPLEVARYRGASEDSSTVAEALARLSMANYIVAGPGSPTYATRQWRGSTVFAAVRQRWEAGADLAFASSAAIALGRYCLPVYEIYKVGAEVYWEDGLDLMADFGLELAIVPHWDNAEGRTHDTRACFMGLERFARLGALLPASTVVLGIDEHTAVCLDLNAGTGQVFGRGGVTLLRGQQEERLTAANVEFPLSRLQSTERLGRRASPARDAGPDESARHLAHAADLLASGDVPAGLRRAAQAAEPEVAALFHQAAQASERAGDRDEEMGRALDRLLEVRAQLRDSQQWELADKLRQALNQMGVLVLDTPDGPRWERAPHGD